MEIFVEIKRLLNTLGLLGRKKPAGIFLDYVIRVVCFAFLLALSMPALLFAIFKTESFAELSETVIVLSGAFTSLAVYTVMLVQRTQTLHLFDKMQKKINEREYCSRLYCLIHKIANDNI